MHNPNPVCLNFSLKFRCFLILSHKNNKVKQFRQEFCTIFLFHTCLMCMLNYTRVTVSRCLTHWIYFPFTQNILIICWAYPHINHRAVKIGLKFVKNNENFHKKDRGTQGKQTQAWLEARDLNRIWKETQGVGDYRESSHYPISIRKSLFFVQSSCPPKICFFTRSYTFMIYF